MTHNQPLAVCPLGRTDYALAWALQQELQRHLIEAKVERRRGQDPAHHAERLPHVLLLTEHPHVFTLGKSGDRAHLLADDATLAARGATFASVDRGGDITYHGPGQLVAYPILDLDRVRYADGAGGTDIHRYLRTLEEVVILTCADYGVAAGRVPGRTGVWVGPDARAERKICAFGIRCSRWVTMHGLAFNLNTDLSYFDHIVPCGIADRGVTSLARELGHPVDEAEATARLVTHFTELFGFAPTFYEEDEARTFLDRTSVASAGADGLAPHSR